MHFSISGGKGFQIELGNGWMISVQFGIHNYCANREYSMKTPPRDLLHHELNQLRETGQWTCGNAEIAVIDPKGSFINNWDKGDDVMGWVNPDTFVALLVEVAGYSRTQTVKDVDFGKPRSRAEVLKGRQVG
jgi:hypothetical protein